MEDDDFSLQAVLRSELNNLDDVDVNELAAALAMRAESLFGM